MAESAHKPNNRSARFPLTLHPTGQYCKKIRGKLFCFGTDKSEALQQYRQQAAFLHTGATVKPSIRGPKVSIKTLCSLYLQHQDTRAAAGEIRPRQLYDQTSLLRGFVKHVGPNRAVSDIATIDLQNYRAKLVKQKKSPATINNHIAAMKAMYHWAADKEIVNSMPNMKAIKKIRPSKAARPVFTPDQIRQLLAHANIQLTGMIWLGLNCGFGCTDCAELLWDNVDLDRRRINLLRRKTGLDRNLPLWPETMRVLPKKNERVFNTEKGNPWVRTIESIRPDGIRKCTNDNALSKEFAKLLKKAGIETDKGVGFYTLRRTAATWAARSGDPFAVQKLLGHADANIACTCVQNVSEQTDKAIRNSRRFIAKVL